MSTDRESPRVLIVWGENSPVNLFDLPEGNTVYLSRVEPDSFLTVAREMLADPEQRHRIQLLSSASSREAHLEVFPLLGVCDINPLPIPRLKLGCLDQLVCLSRENDNVVCTVVVSACDQCTVRYILNKLSSET